MIERHEQVKEPIIALLLLHEVELLCGGCITY